MKRIEVLAFEGCPHVELAIERARAAMTATRMAAELCVSYVESEAAAARLHFVGSPTVRVDGVDVDTSHASRAYGLRCRVYAVDGHLEGAPPAEWIAAALRESGRS